jgi:hypothetical protein
MLQVKVRDAGVEDHADELRALADERARRRARRVVEAPRVLEDALASRLADVG